MTFYAEIERAIVEAGKEPTPELVNAVIKRAEDWPSIANRVADSATIRQIAGRALGEFEAQARADASALRDVVRTPDDEAERAWYAKVASWAEAQGFVPSFKQALRTKQLHLGTVYERNHPPSTAAVIGRFGSLLLWGFARLEIGEKFFEVLDAKRREGRGGYVVVKVDNGETAVLRVHAH